MLIPEQCLAYYATLFESHYQRFYLLNLAVTSHYQRLYLNINLNAQLTMPHYSTYLTLKPQAYLHYSDIFSSARCLLAHQKTNQPPKKLLLLPSQLLDASGLYPQSSNCFVSSALHLCDIILLIFVLEQEKVSKAQAAQNKALIGLDIAQARMLQFQPIIYAF